MFLKAVGKPIEILAKLNELAGFPDNEEIELYEVLIHMCDLIYILSYLFHTYTSDYT